MPSLLRDYPAVLVAVALVGLSTVIVLWAATRPGFDPYGWVVWGHQTLHWNLNTNGAPSWKPLPYLFTVPYALLGHYALWAWEITAVAVSLAGLIFAGRIAYRLTGGSGWAAAGAAAFAALTVLEIQDYTHFILSYQSDTMIVSLCLGAIDCHLSGRHKWAFALLILGSLGRPEVWPFAGLYAIWAWRKFPGMRPMIAGGLLLIPLLWFGVPGLTAKSPFVANNLAFNSPRELHSNKVAGTFTRFFDLHTWPLEVLALISIAWAAYKRDRVTLLIAVGAVIWVLIEIGFALHGFPAVPRYMFEPMAVLAVVAAVLVGRLLRGPPNWVHLPAWSGVLVVLALVGALIPYAVTQVNTEHKDLQHERRRFSQISDLQATIAKAGGRARIYACGRAVTLVEFQSILAWFLHVNVGNTHANKSALAHPNEPLVRFVAGHSQWEIFTIHIPPSRRAACQGLNGLTLKYSPATLGQA